MAKVNFGTIANDARGKINGTVYSKNKSGSYVRRKVSPANPNTTYQSQVRSAFGNFAKAWSGTLTQVQRDAWIGYANTYPRLDVFGNSIQISGMNMFISLNQVQQQATGSFLTDPPPNNVVVPTPIDLAPGQPAITAPGTCTFQQTGAGDGLSPFYIFATRGLPPGRQPQDSDFRFIGLVPQAAAGPYPVSFSPASIYIAKFGNFVAGLKYGFLISTVDNLQGLVTVGAKISNIAV